MTKGKFSYRVVRRVLHDKASGCTFVSYGIKSVYTVDGKIQAWDEEFYAPYGETIDELTEEVRKMAGAARRTVLEELDDPTPECTILVDTGQMMDFFE